MNLHRIEAKVHLTNLASQKTLQKFGFQQEGILRDKLKAGNNYLSVGIYALLSTDFRIKKSDN